MPYNINYIHSTKIYMSYYTKLQHIYHIPGIYEISYISNNHKLYKISYYTKLYYIYIP